MNIKSTKWLQVTKKEIWKTSRLKFYHWVNLRQICVDLLWWCLCFGVDALGRGTGALFVEYQGLWPLHNSPHQPKLDRQTHDIDSLASISSQHHFLFILWKNNTLVCNVNKTEKYFNIKIWKRYTSKCPAPGNTHLNITSSKDMYQLIFTAWLH